MLAHYGKLIPRSSGVVRQPIDDWAQVGEGQRTVDEARLWLQSVAADVGHEVPANGVGTLSWDIDEVQYRRGYGRGYSVDGQAKKLDCTACGQVLRQVWT